MKKIIAIGIILLLIPALSAGCRNRRTPADVPEGPGDQQQEEQQPQYEEREILLFYPDRNNNYLLHEFRKVTVEKEISAAEMAEIVLAELIKGADNSELKSIVPRLAKVLSLELDGSTVNVDLSEEFIAQKYTNREKLLQVFSVVNTLSELEMEEVNLLVEGKPITEYYASLKLEMPLVRNDDLIPSK